MGDPTPMLRQSKTVALTLEAYTGKDLSIPVLTVACPMRVHKLYANDNMAVRNTRHVPCTRIHAMIAMSGQPEDALIPCSPTDVSVCQLVILKYEC